jgi:hypothetical protein
MNEIREQKSRRKGARRAMGRGDAMMISNLEILASRRHPTSDSPGKRLAGPRFTDTMTFFALPSSRLDPRTDLAAGSIWLQLVCTRLCVMMGQI